MFFVPYLNNASVFFFLIKILATLAYVKTMRYFCTALERTAFLFRMQRRQGQLRLTHLLKRYIAGWSSW